jgi:hypothetical protein
MGLGNKQERAVSVRVRRFLYALAMARRFRRGTAKKIRVYHYNTSTKAYPATGSPDITTMAGYKQLDRQSFALEGGGAGAGLVSMYDLFMDPGLDIRLNDQVLLDDSSTVYKVFKVFQAPTGPARNKRVTIATDAQT